uniref:Deoxyuridine 5'-triphosphate nucleotidohydrolase n=1 Tax=Timema monikensis TaxID=170555 RepID=A0A7R9EH91_9NEOP|nr:unnamed protein product [Timema monikensis]
MKECDFDKILTEDTELDLELNNHPMIQTAPLNPRDALYDTYTIPTGDKLGDMTNELTAYSESAYITEFVSGGPNNHSYNVFVPETNEYRSTTKVRGVTLNYENTKIVNFTAIKDMILKDMDPVLVTNPRKIKRKRGPIVVSQLERKNNILFTKLSSVLKYQKINRNAISPVRATTHSAGLDLKSLYNCSIQPSRRRLVKINISIILPAETYGRISPQSSLALHHRIDVLAGVIDEDYRVNICVLLINHGDTVFRIKRGDKIAQLVCVKMDYPRVEHTNSLSNTQRGEGGFGSSDITIKDRVIVLVQQQQHDQRNTRRVHIDVRVCTPFHTEITGTI